MLRLDPLVHVWSWLFFSLPPSEPLSLLHWASEAAHQVSPCDHWPLWSLFTPGQGFMSGVPWTWEYSLSSPSSFSNFSSSVGLFSVVISSRKPYQLGRISFPQLPFPSLPLLLSPVVIPHLLWVLWAQGCVCRSLVWSLCPHQSRCSLVPVSLVFSSVSSCL